MAAEVELRGAGEIQAYLKNLPDRLFVAAKKAIAIATFATHAQVARNVRSGPITSRSGTLGRSLTPEVGGTTFATLQGSVYSDVVYAGIQERGGVVKAKRAYRSVPGGPYLNIPTRANRTAAGVMRQSARDVFGAGGYVTKMRSGKYGVFLRGQLMFSLRKEVTIAPRLGLAQAAEDQVPTLLADLDQLYQQTLGS